MSNAVAEKLSVLKMPEDKVNYEMAMNEYQETLAKLQETVKLTTGIMERQKLQSEKYKEINNKIAILQDKYSKDVEEKIKAEEQRYLNIDTSALDNKISSINSDIEDLKKQYNESLADINEDTAKEQLSDIQEDINELRKYVTTIQEQLEDRFGTATLTAINNRIDSKGSPTLTDEELNELQDMAYELIEKLELQLNKKSLNIYKAVDTVVDGSYNVMEKSLGPDTADKAYIFLSLGALALMYFWDYGIFLIAIPFAIMAGSFYNTYTSNKQIVDEYLPLRQLSQLADMKEEGMNKQIESIMEDMRLELDNEFNEIMAEYEESLTATKQELEDLKANALSGFDRVAFIESLQADHNNKIKRFTEMGKEEFNKLQEIDKESKEMVITLQQLKANIELLKELIQKLATTLTGVGSSFYLPEFFFLGINESTGKPMTFEWNKRANVILYNDNSKYLIQNIITYIHSQIIMYTNPTKILPYLVDLKNGGIDYAKFSPREEWKLPQIFKRIGTAQEVADMISGLAKINANILNKILIDHSTVHEFNQAMLAKNSLTTEYHLLYLVDYQPNIFSDITLKQVIENSEKLGIIPLVFVHEEVVTGIRNGDQKLYEQGHLDLFKAIHRESLYRLTENNIGISQVPSSVGGEPIYEADILKNDIKNIEEGK